MLGITLACSRCHDHKYDPISQRDYYQMLAFLRPSQRLNHNLTQLAEPELVRRFDSRKAQFKKWLRPREAQLLRSRLTQEGVSSSDRKTLIRYTVGKTTKPDPQLLGILNRLKLRNEDEIREALRQHLEPEEAVLLDQYEKEVSDLEARVEFAFGIRDEDHQVPETYVLRGGQPANKAERVEPAFLPVLTDPSTDSKRWFKKQPSRESGTTYLRSALARWIVDPEAGAGLLAARVMVNRIWAHLMNAPLVQSVDNFGMAGLAPTFDGPNDTISVGRRQTTTLPTQSLYLLNSEFVREHAGYFAERIRDRGGENPNAQIKEMYRLSLAREATLEEIELSRRFLRDQAESYSGTGERKARSPEDAGRLALADLCQAVLALDEFVYVN